MDRTTHTIIMHQQSYIESVLKQFGIENCKPIRSSLSVETLLAKRLEEKHEEYLHVMKEIMYNVVVGVPWT